MFGFFGSPRRFSKGSVLIETILALPLLLILALSIIEASNWFLLKGRLERAAYEGVRFASTFPSFSEGTSECGGHNVPYSHTHVCTRVIRICDKLNFPIRNKINIDMTRNNPAGESIRLVKVEVVVPYRPVVLNVLNLFGLDEISAQHVSPYVSN